MIELTKTYNKQTFNKKNIQLHENSYSATKNAVGFVFSIIGHRM